MSFDLDGKAALVTGGSRGIGRAIAEALAAFGADIGVMARDATLLGSVVEGIERIGGRAVAVPCDVADTAAVTPAVAHTVEELGGLDIVVNAAGVADTAPPQDLAADVWNEVLAVNLRGSFEVARAAYPHLAASGDGRIVNIGSIYSLLGTPDGAAYGASKGGVVQLTRSLAVSWADTGILVNAILPGWIVTDMTERDRASAEFRSKVEERTPLGRFGAPEEIAGAAVFLCSPAAGFLTGHALVVDGGYSIA